MDIRVVGYEAFLDGALGAWGAEGGSLFLGPLLPKELAPWLQLP